MGETIPTPPWMLGIDYGSKLAGTTALSLLPAAGTQMVEIFQTQKKEDADAFILEFAGKLPPGGVVGIDAPLSLPGVFVSLPNCNDYFYREADRQVGAMSPMFLGGLTARAMRLQAKLSQHTSKLQEVYPGGLIRLLELNTPGYKGKATELPEFWNALEPLLPFSSPMPQNWHQLDSLLALWSVWRLERQQAVVVGNPSEGLIVL